jgi:hypothetical protein
MAILEEYEQVASTRGIEMLRRFIERDLLRIPPSERHGMIVRLRSMDPRHVAQTFDMDIRDLSRSDVIELLADFSRLTPPSWNSYLSNPSLDGLLGSSMGGQLGGFGGGLVARRAAPVPDKPSTDILTAMAAPELVEGDARQALAVEVEDVLGYTPLRRDAKAPSRLQRVLTELQIEAFDPEKVAEYKKKMRLHFQTIEDNRLAKDPFSTTRTEVQWHMKSLTGYTKPVPEFVLRKCVTIKQAMPDATFHVDELIETRRNVTFDPFLVVNLGEDQAVIEVWDELEFEKTL